MQPFYIVIFIILGTGLFGGVVNYFMLNTGINNRDHHLKLNKTNLWLKSMFMGVAAAILVPLFLNTISSAVLTNILSNKDPYINCLIFAGFCLIASISSRRFIGDLYERVLTIDQKASEAKEQAGKAQDDAISASKNAHKALSDTHDLINAATEHNRPAMRAMTQSASLTDAAKQDPTDEEKLIDAFTASKYIFRTQKGLANDSKLAETEVVTLLNQLQNKGQVKSRLNDDGDTVWQLIHE